MRGGGVSGLGFKEMTWIFLMRLWKVLDFLY